MLADMIRSQSQRRHATTSPQRSHTLAQYEALDGCRDLRGTPLMVGREEPMQTQGEMEAAICGPVSRLEQEQLGQELRDIHAPLIGDLLMVCLHRVLTAAEQQLVKPPPAKGACC
jgi:Na+-translocating membrane potential-generating system (MpsC)